ncbi:MAG: SWIM zinc finger family protein, partial [Acidimicrobiales bacterium]
MSGRSWDDPWRHYPPSVPLPAEGGLASSKQRGPMAETWWSRRFTEVLESYGVGGRMQRGRRYARTGQVLSLDVQPGLLVCQVQGSRRTPYLVTVRLAVPTEAQWSTVEAAMTAKVGFVAHLLAGEVPPDLEDVFAAAGVALFPRSWSDLGATCSCPDWENPCKHIAAVLYLLADRLDSDPWLLLAWRGRGRDEIVGRLRARPEGTRGHPEVATWWPFPAGAFPGTGG